MLARLFLASCICVAATPALADVVSSGPSGFLVHFEFVSHRDPAATWQRLVRPQDWWSKEHTYSQDAANLSLTLAPGGCWCEQLPGGGFVRHMEVVYAAPGKGLRLLGGLGPLQKMGASGALSFALKPSGEHDTTVVVDYAVTGYAAGGFTEIAGAVNDVLAEALKHLVAG